MVDWLFWLIAGVIPMLSWLCGYHFGKADGIREVRYLLGEQRRDYDRFRDLVFREMGIEVSE